VQQLTQKRKVMDIKKNKKTFNNVCTVSEDRGHLITPVCNTQLPKVITGKSPTSDILLGDDVSVITQPIFLVSKASCLEILIINSDCLFFRRQPDVWLSEIM